MKNTYLINAGFKRSGVDCWHNAKTDHFIAKDNKGYHLSYLFGAELGLYPSLKQIENFLSNKPYKYILNSKIMEKGIDNAKQKNILFDCRCCRGVFQFTDEVKQHNYIAGIGFYCDSCIYEYEQEAEDWQKDC